MLRLNPHYKTLEALYERSNDQPALFRYGIATLLVLVAFALRFFLNPVLEDQVPLTFFLTSALLAALFGGVGPGLFALAIGLLLGDYFFLPPVGSLGGYGPHEWANVFSNVVPSLMAIFLIQFLHHSRTRVRAHATEIKRASARLEEEIQKRKEAEAALLQAQEDLKEYALYLEEKTQDRTRELEKSLKFLEEFCYTIAHDLRAPLRAIQGFVQALQQDYAPTFDATGREYAQRVIDAAEKMDRLIMDLLDYGSLSHARIHLTQVGLGELIHSVLLELQDQMPPGEVEVRLGNLGFSVWADAKFTAQASRHLLINALQFRDAQRKLQIEIMGEEKPAMIRVWFRDNGIGIEPRFQERIFRMFERLNPKPHFRTGVGLAIVAKRIERMGGQVGVDSQPGVGSAFWFELPKVRSAKDHLTKGRPHAMSELFRSGKRE